MREARERIRRLAAKLDLCPPLSIADLVDDIADALLAAEHRQDWTRAVGVGIALRALAAELHRGAMSDGVRESALAKIEILLEGEPPPRGAPRAR